MSAALDVLTSRPAFQEKNEERRRKMRSLPNGWETRNQEFRSFSVARSSFAFGSPRGLFASPGKVRVWLVLDKWLFPNPAPRFSCLRLSGVCGRAGLNNWQNHLFSLEAWSKEINALEKHRCVFIRSPRLPTPKFVDFRSVKAQFVRSLELKASFVDFQKKLSILKALTNKGLRIRETKQGWSNGKFLLQSRSKKSRHWAQH